MHDVGGRGTERAQVNTALLHLWPGYTLLFDVASMHKVAAWLSTRCRTKWPPTGGVIRRHSWMVVGDGPKRAQSERCADIDGQGSVSHAPRQYMGRRAVCGRELSCCKISPGCCDRNGNRTGRKIKSTYRCVVRCPERLPRRSSYHSKWHSTS